MVPCIGEEGGGDDGNIKEWVEEEVREVVVVL
jgi:hypothetical protein